MIDVSRCNLVENVWRPFAYQVGNCDDPYAASPFIRQFASRVVRPPSPYSPIKDKYPIANGLLNAGYWVDAQFDALVTAADVTENSHRVPGNSLEARQGFLGAIARAVSDIHITMDLSRSISPRVLTLGVSSVDGRVALRE